MNPPTKSLSTSTKSLLAFLAVLGASGAVVVGVLARDRVDLGGVQAPPTIPTDGLIASRGDIPEGDYFYKITQLLKDRYVEPIKDEQKLALGAIRGMVSSLGDPDSFYLDKDEYRVYQNTKQGKYEGIGVQVELIYDSAPSSDKPLSTKPTAVGDDTLLRGLRIPKLTVVTVVPGGPADKAGIKSGDWIEYVDDHWVPNAETVTAFRRLERDVTQGKAKLEALVKMRNELRTRTKKTILPLKAKDRMIAGVEGSIKLVWRHNALSQTATIAKAESAMPGFKAEGTEIQLPFFKGSAEQLKAAIAGKDRIVINLRNNAVGDFQAMKDCLAVLVPKGTYGSLKASRKTIPFTVAGEGEKHPEIVLLVDRSTRGLAEIFALALSSKGLAKLSGGEMAGHRIVVEDNPLPDGSGYTLATAEYQK